MFVNRFFPSLVVSFQTLIMMEGVASSDHMHESRQPRSEEYFSSFFALRPATSFSAKWKLFASHQVKGFCEKGTTVQGDQDKSRGGDKLPNSRVLLIYFFIFLFRWVYPHCIRLHYEAGDTFRRMPLSCVYETIFPTHEFVLRQLILRTIENFIKFHTFKIYFAIKFMVNR